MADQVELVVAAEAPAEENQKEAWDYVLMMAPKNPPKDKQGNQLPEEDKNVKKFREIEQEREKAIAALKDNHVGLHVEVKDGSDGDTRYVLLRASEERLLDQAEQVELSMQLKAEFGSGYMAFTKDKQTYFEPNSKDFFFKKTQRMYLVKSIIQGDPDFGGAGLNINLMIRTGVCNKVFPLHSKPEKKKLMDEWANLKKFYKYQPLDEIRDYFGEEIGFYFAWLGFYTQWLWYATILGTIAFIIWLADLLIYPLETDENDVTSQAAGGGFSVWALTIYSVFIMLWATFFLEFWKRYNHELAFRWGVMDYESSEEQRADFNGVPHDGVYVNGEWIPLDSSHDYGFEIPKNKYYPSNYRKSKIASALPLLITMLIVVVIATFCVLSFRLFVQQQHLSVFGSIVGGVVNSIVIIAMNVFWRIVADKLTVWENHRTQTEFDDALTFKIFLFQFVNSYTSLYYIAFFKSNSKFWGTQQDGCKISGKPEGTVGWGCTIELSVQLATLLATNMFIGQTREVAVPFIMAKIQRKMLEKKAGEEKDFKDFELDGKLAPYQGTFDEYCEMVIQFGFITLFAAAFPISPLLAVLNNMVEIRTDAFKLLGATVRPHYRGAQDIGSWYKILDLMGVVSVITNCLLIGFSYKSISDLFNDARLENRSFQIFAAAVVTEHIVLGLKYLIAEIIPDVPGWVRKEMARSQFIKEQTFNKLEAHEKKVYKDE